MRAMQSRFRFLIFVLGASLALASCSSGDSSAVTPDGGVPNSGVDPFADLGTDMAQWDPSLEGGDAINHTALGLADPPDIHWQNRPTWQQVVQPTEDVLQ
jgi:hypothetical protein